MKETKKNSEPVRDETGKFKKAIEPQPEEPAAEGATSMGERLAEAEEEARPLIKTRVAGQSTKLAAIQTGRLKWKDGQPLPELEGEENDDK